MQKILFALIAAFLMLLAGVPQSASAQMNVPVYGQQWGPWNNDQLGFGGAGSTIGRYGCAVTSVSMVRQYFGGGVLTPRDMNNWLKGNGGFSGDLIIWNAVRGFAGSRDYRNVAADLNLINSLLDRGYLLIVQTMTGSNRSQTHWVVLRGHSGNTYYMCDPLYGDNGTTFNARYGDPARWIFGMNIFQRP